MAVRGTLPRAQADRQSARRSLRWNSPTLIAVGISSLVLVLGLWSIPWNEPAAPFNRDCDTWDRLASAAVSDLVADRSPMAEQRLGDAVFRLRRARKYCRYDLVGLARLDYEALTDGRYGRR